jgi:hypothetical protein
MDLCKIKGEQFIPFMLHATKKNTTLEGEVYGLPHIWGTERLVVSQRLPSRTSSGTLPCPLVLRKSKVASWTVLKPPTNYI